MEAAAEQQIAETIILKQASVHPIFRQTPNLSYKRFIHKSFQANIYQFSHFTLNCMSDSPTFDDALPRSLYVPQVDPRAHAREMVNSVFNDKFMIALSVVILPIILVSYFFRLTPQEQSFLNIVDGVIVILFVVEYVSKLYLAQNRWQHFKSPWHLVQPRNNHHTLHPVSLSFQFRHPRSPLSSAQTPNDTEGFCGKQQSSNWKTNKRPNSN